MNNESKIEGDQDNNFQGISNSTIIINPDKSETAKTPLSVPQFIPTDFPPRVPYFTGRVNELAKIGEALETHGTAGLADTHGVGKSSVACEFAHLYQQNYTHILYLLATANGLDISVSKILDSLKINLPTDAAPAERLSVFQTWLAENQNWLLVVDKVDDYVEIHNCRFNQPNGKVIYTSNDEQIFWLGTKVELTQMSNEDSMLLLYKHWTGEAKAEFTDIPENYRQTLHGIVEKFGNHPFSLAFVGAYLNNESESLNEFLEIYQSKTKNLLAKYKFLSNYPHGELATVFLLRFEQISTPKDDTEREQFLSIAVQDYLKLSAFIGTDNIPEELLQKCLALLHEEQTEFTNDQDFIKEVFKKFQPTSIFKRNSDNKTLTTHPIVREIMRFQIADEEDIILETLAKGLADNFEIFDSSNFEIFNFSNKEKVERYLLHVGVFLEYLETNKLDAQANLKLENESTAKLCNGYASYFEYYGENERKIAKKYYEFFKNICEIVFDGFLREGEFLPNFFVG